MVPEDKPVVSQKLAEKIMNGVKKGDYIAQKAQMIKNGGAYFMKLWEIKAQALRLMFADTDIEFSFAEFENNSIYENANTREKLIRMNDSIRRAIDLYYHYHGEQI